MKKCTAFILSFLLLISASGMSFTVHFCGDRIASISSGLISKPDPSPEMEKCCAEKAKENKPCCSDKEVKLKAKPEPVSKQELQKVVFISPSYSQISFTPDTRDGLISRTITYYCEAHSPPLYKLYHQYIFYA